MVLDTERERRERGGGGGGDIILVEKHQYLYPEYALMVI